MNKVSNWNRIGSGQTDLIGRSARWLAASTLLLVLTITAAGLPTTAAADAKPAIPTGDTPAYEELGRWAIQQDGRLKPFDTYARQMMKRVAGKERPIVVGPEGERRVWNPVAAVFDWAIHPDEWNQRRFILVEYQPLKAFLFRERVVNALAAAREETQTQTTRERIDALLSDPLQVTSRDLDALAATPNLSPPIVAQLDDLAARLAEDSKWVSPAELQSAQVQDQGRSFPFIEWAISVNRPNRAGGMGSEDPRTPLETKAGEAVQRLISYLSISERMTDRGDPMRILPRPVNDTQLGYVAATFRKLRSAAAQGQNPSLTPLENDTLFNLNKYLGEISRKKHLEFNPDAGEAWDQEFVVWLKQNHGKDYNYVEWSEQFGWWVPLGVVLATSPEELTRAGYDSEKMAAFRSAFEALESALLESVESPAVEPAREFVASARVLGEATSSYPGESILDWEIRYNEDDPFRLAQIPYLAALVLLILGLVVSSSLGLKANPDAEAPSSLTAQAPWAGRLLAGLGMLAFLVGMGLEVYGFVLRVWITGWAPVTNMYETVVWVGFVTSALAFGLAVLSRRALPAIGGAIVAVVATVLAANVPLGGEEIKSLTPVLRSNYWLTIHVLTIVSSYAAFALALGLGLIGTLVYLTTTYKRSVGYRELVGPAVYGLPILGLGLWGMAAHESATSGFLASKDAYYLAAVVGIGGGFLILTSLFAMLGEGFNRLVLRPGLADAAIPSPGSTETAAKATTSDAPQAQPAERPNVSEILARARASSDAQPPMDPRERSMRRTAASLKPVVAAIYRSMQIGVLLVTAGTILGGAWADVSWGRFWGWDPKEVWALITLLVYLIPLHGRFAGWIGNFGMVASSVVCFMSVLMAWYGVNFVLGVGLHSYGFVEGGGQLTVAAVSAAVISLVSAAALRRGKSYRAAPAPGVATHASVHA